MKNFKIVAAAAALALVSGYAAASTAPMTVGVTLSSPISLMITTPLSMPSLVIPPAGASSVILPADGSTITYTGGGSAGSNNTSGTIGVVTVSGEGSYVFDISASATPPAGSGLTLDTFTFYDGTSTDTSFALSGGTASIDVGATLTATSSATTAAIPVVVTVVYAP